MKFTTGQLLRYFAGIIAPYKKRFFLGTLSRVSSDIASLCVPLVISSVVTFAASYTVGADLTPFFWMVVGIGVLVLYRNISIQTSKYLLNTLAERLGIEMQLRSIQHIFSLDLLWHEKENTGNKLKKVARAADGINTLIRVYEGIFIESVINFFAVSVIFFRLSWELAAMMLFFFLTYAFLMVSYTRKISQTVRVVNKREEVFEGLKFEGMNSIHTMKSLGMYENFGGKLEGHGLDLMEAVRRRVATVRSSWAVAGIYQGIFRLVLLTYTSIMVMQGHFEVGTIALVLLYFGMMEESANEFAQLQQSVVEGRLNIGRLQEIMAERPATEFSGTLPFNTDWKEFRFNHVHFAFGDKEILKDLSFTIRRGEKVGIVGISGAGKSTLMKLMLKLYDGYEGTIAFDDVPLHDIRRASYIARVATVPQDTEVFHFSLRDNILLADANEHNVKARLKRALHIAHVDEFLPRLPEGEDTLIGEKGVKLSGGERQRLGIARAVYRQPDILLLDEATSHLDATSEQRIQEALHEFFQGVTAIVIAHRLSTLKEMDRILVIKEGRLVEEGTFDTLLAKKGEFATLWEKQKL